MNIFILDEDPKVAASLVIDKHSVKMPLESMQMMSTIADHLGLDSPYDPVMLNHPCTIWARESRQNFQWLRSHLEGLLDTYAKRYWYTGNTHKVSKTLEEYSDVFDKVEELLPDIGLTPFAVAISHNQLCRQKVENFDDLSVVEQYRAYYIHDKKWFASWKWPHYPPKWYTQMAGSC